MVVVALKNLLFPSTQNAQLDATYAPLPLPVYDPRSRDYAPAAKDAGSLWEKEYARTSSLQLLSQAQDGPPSMTNTRHRRIDPRILSDLIIGLSDGLTVPFALTAGLSALGETRVVVMGGLAELMAGAISMGLGGWLAARSEAEAHAALESSTSRLVRGCPDRAAATVHDALLAYFPSLAEAPAVSPSPPPPYQSHSSSALWTSSSASQALCRTTTCPSPAPSMPYTTALSTLTRALASTTPPDQLVSFLLALQSSSPSTSATSTPPSYLPRTPIISAATIALGYFAGGFLPLLPYMFSADIATGFRASVAVMAVALFVFGAGRAWSCGADSAGELDEEQDEEWKEHRCEGLAVGPTSTRKKRLWMRGWVALGPRCVAGGGQMVVMGGAAAAAAMACVRAFQ